MRLKPNVFYQCMLEDTDGHCLAVSTKEENGSWSRCSRFGNRSLLQGVEASVPGK